MNIQEQANTIQLFLQSLSWLLPQIHRFLSPRSYTYEDVTLTIRSDGTSMIYLQKSDSNVSMDKLESMDIELVLLRLTHIADAILRSGEVQKLVTHSSEVRFVVILYSMLNISEQMKRLDESRYTKV